MATKEEEAKEALAAQLALQQEELELKKKEELEQLNQEIALGEQKKAEALTQKEDEMKQKFAEEQQLLLFNKFIQLDNSNARQRGGTGLGLAICKELVERMDGQVGVRSREGAGACFWFRLPLSRTVL